MLMFLSSIRKNGFLYPSQLTAHVIIAYANLDLDASLAWRSQQNAFLSQASPL